MKTILLADDDELVRKRIKQAVQAAGHRVMAVENGVAAVKVCDQQPVDLAIIDIMMPDKDGLETIRALRLAHPDLKIIAMSGGGKYMWAEDALKIAKIFGANEILAKPFAIDDILEATGNLLYASMELATLDVNAGSRMDEKLGQGIHQGNSQGTAKERLVGTTPSR